MIYTSTFAESLSLTAETYPDLEALQLQLWGPETKSRVDNVERQIAKQAAEKLKEWKAPAVSVTAALLLPLLSRERRHWPRTGFSDEALELAQRLADRRAFLVPGEARGGASAAWHYSNLSRMYREAYLDWPQLSFTLLLLAHHDALLLHGPTFSEDDARLTQRVFAPFAEMLGMWSLYRTWLELSYKTLFVKEYEDMQELMGPTDAYKEEKFEEILKPKPNKDSASSHKKTNLIDKASAFLNIKEKLEEKFALKKLEAEVRLIENLTGLALRRVRENEAREDVARRLGMRILCESSDDCYSALGILHSLGRPISLGSVLHFQDHIASPQPNGYRALEAAITYSGYKAAGGGSIVIECRILTHEMHRMNNYGVVVARYDADAPTAPDNAWWNQIPKLNAQLSRMLRLNTIDDSILTKYLSTHDHGAESNPIYVFTPRGEILLLPQGSTALDFAYRIHTEMGHHALRIDVNGESVPHGYPLRKGDIVRIHYDPDYAGPDFSWLNLVATQSARTSIKRKLAARARAAHEGRAYVEAALLRALNNFQSQKKFNLNVTTARLESFLRERATAYGYSDVTKLYDQLKDDPDGERDPDIKNELAQRLVGDLVSSELTASITDADGEPLYYVLDYMKICQTCLPVPGDPIVGCEIVSSSGMKKLNIHVAGQRCVTTVTQERILKLAWSDELNIDKNELLVFTLTCDDRPRLLYEVLDAVHQTEEAYLYKVEATTFTDQQAVISLVVKADNYNRFGEIQNRLGNVAGVHKTATVPPSPAQRMTLVADPLRRQLPRELPPPLPNPYTSEEVYTRDIFFDRRELLDSIMSWLKEPPPYQPMILHGQRRVGKTSLVMHLIHEFLPAHRLAHAVLVDFQELSAFAPQNIAGLIVRSVFRDRRQSIPPQEDGEEPMEWLSRALDKAREIYPDLLIIIDEFNVIIDVELKSNSQSPVYKNLRGVMRNQRSINWLIVVQDTHFYDPERFGGAGVLFQNARRPSVEHLDRNWSQRLILEPARRCGVVPEDEEAIIDEVLNLTAGNPLLIHLICRELVERARRQGRGVFTMADLEAARDVLLHDGESWFFHFMQNLTGTREIVMAAVTEIIRNEGQANESEVIELVREKLPEITVKTVQQTVVSLAQEGLILVQRQDKEGPLGISIHIGLFKKFLFRLDRMDIDKSVAKWRSSRRAATKRKLQKKNDQARPVG